MYFCLCRPLAKAKADKKKYFAQKMLNMRLHMKYSICSKIRYKNHLQTAKIATWHRG